MMFDSLYGNLPIKAYLTQALQKNRLPHALLFAGLDGIGKRLFAHHLAAHLLKTPLERIERGHHPDFHPLFPDGKVGLHSIETLRSLIDEVYSAPFEAQGKVFLLHDAERMQPAAANALLKTLEEPAPDTTLILITSAPGEILPTLRSRSILLSFQPLPEADIAALLKQSGYPEELARLAQGSAGRAFHLATRPQFEEPLFALLSQPPPYHQLSQAIEKIGALVEEENPIQKQKNVERLFSALLMWVRDQTAPEAGPGEIPLFFPKAPPASRPISLEAAEKAIREAQLSFSRNMKLSTCLDFVFEKLLT